MFGIYFGYNYVRLFLTRLYVQEDNNIIDKELVNLINDQGTDNLEKLEAISLADKTDDFAFNKPELDKAISDAKTKLTRGQLMNAEDPQKGQWGGLSEKDGYRLRAKVEELKGNPNLFKIHLVVESINQDRVLETADAVIFNLHDSFNKPHKVAFVKDGKAELDLITWGAFTVGALIVSKNIQLELDLSALSDAPKLFRER